MPYLEVKKMAFKKGMEIRLEGHMIYAPDYFTINIGHSLENIALHCDLRFDLYGDNHKMVLNSLKNNVWQEEVKVSTFPFKGGEDFTMAIIFNPHTFDIYLHDGSVVKFPNRTGETQFDYMFFSGDGRLDELIVRPF